MKYFSAHLHKLGCPQAFRLTKVICSAYFTAFLGISKAVCDTATHSIYIQHMVLFWRRSKDGKMHWFWNTFWYLLHVKQRIIVGNCSNLTTQSDTVKKPSVWQYVMSSQWHERNCEKTTKYCLKMARNELRYWPKHTLSSNKANSREFGWSGDSHSYNLASSFSY